MTRPRSTGAPALLALLLLGGCAPFGGGGPRGAGAGTGGKADCSDDDACADAARDSALAELGLDRRFLRRGDRWSVAWVYRNDDSPHRDDAQQLGNVTEHVPTLVAYEVVEDGTARFGSTYRDVATVSVTTASTAPEELDGLVWTPTTNVDERIDYTVNELFNPVSKTFYAIGQSGRELARTVDLDGRSNLTMQFDSLPNAYPNLDRIKPRARCDDAFHRNRMNPRWDTYTACWDAPPTLPPELAAIAEQAGLDYARPGIHFKVTEAQPDFMFWQPGNLHPSYIEGPRGRGVLATEGAL